MPPGSVDQLHAFGSVHQSSGSSWLDWTWWCQNEARCFCRCHALSTSYFSAEPWENSCHATLSSNISLKLPFISQAEPPPPFVWLLPLLSHHHNQLNSHVMVIVISFIFNSIQQLNNARKNNVYISVNTLKHCCICQWSPEKPQGSSSWQPIW